jgi:type III secretory pathway component EscR
MMDYKTVLIQKESLLDLFSGFTWQVTEVFGTSIFLFMKFVGRDWIISEILIRRCEKIS